MRNFALLTSLFFATFAFSDDGIYGTDDRADVYRARSSLEAELADSTIALVESTNLKKNEDGSYTLKTDTFGSRYGLCKSENFYSQPVGSAASGALVGPELVLTAAHTIEDAEDCLGKKIVFGYHAKADGEFNTTFPGQDVAQCKEIVIRDEENDFLIFRINRKITHHKSLALNRNEAPKVGSELVVIGHPNGLPTKISPGQVLLATPIGIITDNDTYGGNSGSPAFNPKTGLIEGVLSRGGTDFTNGKNRCVQSVVVTRVKCKNGSCDGGETIIPSALFSKHIPEISDHH